MRHNQAESQAKNKDSVLTKAVKKYSELYFEFFMDKILKLNISRLQDIGDGKYKYNNLIFSRDGFVTDKEKSTHIPLYQYFCSQYELSETQGKYFILQMIADTDDIDDAGARALFRHYNAIRYSLKIGGLL